MALGVDPYSVLGVSRDATDKQIARARHRLVLRYHPDVNPSPDAAARFDEVQQAFHLLSDPAARAESDRTHEEQGQARPAQRSGTATGTGIFVQPGTVDFGWLVPGLPGADGKVAVFPELTCASRQWYRLRRVIEENFMELQAPGVSRILSG